MGAAKLFSVLLAMRLLDRLGRRPLLLGGAVATAASLGLLGYAFWVESDGLTLLALLLFVASYGLSRAPTLRCRRGVTPLALGPTDAHVRGLIGRGWPKPGAALGPSLPPRAGAAWSSIWPMCERPPPPCRLPMHDSLAPTFFVLLSELFSDVAKPLAAGLATSLTFGAGALVDSIFLTLRAELYDQATCGLLGAVCLAGGVAVLCLLPETKGRTRLEVQRLMRGGGGGAGAGAVGASASAAGGGRGGRGRADDDDDDDESTADEDEEQLLRHASSSAVVLAA